MWDDGYIPKYLYFLFFGFLDMVLDIYTFYFFVMWLSLSTYFIFLIFGNLIMDDERLFVMRLVSFMVGMCFGLYCSNWDADGAHCRKGCADLKGKPREDQFGAACGPNSLFHAGIVPSVDRRSVDEGLTGQSLPKFRDRGPPERCRRGCGRHDG